MAMHDQDCFFFFVAPPHVNDSKRLPMTIITIAFKSINNIICTRKNRHHTKIFFRMKNGFSLSRHCVFPVSVTLSDDVTGPGGRRSTVVQHCCATRVVTYLEQASTLLVTHNV